MATTKIKATSIANNAVTSAAIADDAVTIDKISDQGSDGQVLTSTGSGVAWERPGRPPSACRAVARVLPSNYQAFGETAPAADLVTASESLQRRRKST